VHRMRHVPCSPSVRASRRENVRSGIGWTSAVRTTTADGYRSDGGGGNGGGAGGSDGGGSGGGESWVKGGDWERWRSERRWRGAAGGGGRAKKTRWRGRRGRRE
jgi:hypothetical protein